MFQWYSFAFSWPSLCGYQQWIFYNSFLSEVCIQAFGDFLQWIGFVGITSQIALSKIVKVLLSLVQLVIFQCKDLFFFGATFAGPVASTELVEIDNAWMHKVCKSTRGQPLWSLFAGLKWNRLDKCRYYFLGEFELLNTIIRIKVLWCFVVG